MKVSKVTLDMQRNIRAAMVWDSLHTIALRDKKSDYEWIKDCAAYRDKYLNDAGFPAFDKLAKHS